MLPSSLSSCWPGAPGAGRRLSRSVMAEAAVALLVLYAAAEMVSTSPEDLTHRVG